MIQPSVKPLSNAATIVRSSAHLTPMKRQVESCGRGDRRQGWGALINPLYLFRPMISNVNGPPLHGQRSEPEEKEKARHIGHGRYHDARGQRRINTQRL